MRPLIRIAALWLAVSPIVLAQGFTYEQFDVPGAQLTRPFGVNASGQIVGLYRDSQNRTHGFLRNLDSTYLGIDYPGATFTNAAAINARGDIVGRWTDTAGMNHGYLRTPQGHFVQVDPPAPCVVTTQQTVVHGINDIGDLVGRCFDVAGKQLGWLWSHHGFQVFDDPAHSTTDVWMVTNRGAVVGDYSDGSSFVHGYLWTAGEGLVTLDVPGSQTGLRDMNDRGDITGVYFAAGRFHGFLLRDGAFETIDYPGSVNGGPQGGTLVVNNAGLIVGGFIDTGGLEHGFIAH
jgi:hypothetical protein